MKLGTHMIDHKISRSVALLSAWLLVAGVLLSFVLFLSLSPDHSYRSWALFFGAIVSVLLVILILLNWVLGVYLFVATLPFEGTFVLGPVASGTKLLALLTFFSLALRLLQDPGLVGEFWRLLRQPLVVGVLILALWCLASTLWAGNQDAALVAAMTQLGLLGLLLIVALLTKKQLTVLWIILTASTSIAALVSLVLQTTATYGVASAAPEVGRFTSEGVDPNEYAGLVVIVLLVAYYGVLNRSRVVKYVVLATLFLAVLASQSRTGLVTFVATPLVVLLPLVLLVPAPTARFLGRTLLTISLAALVFVGLVFTTPVVGEVVAERFASLSELETASTWSGRLGLWQGAIQTILSHPVLGVGAGNFVYESSAYSALAGGGMVAHNMILSVWSELGTIGVAIFLCILVSAFTEVLKLVRRDLTWGLALLLGLTAYFILGQTLTWEREEMAYLLYGSILCLQSKRIPEEQVASTEGQKH